MGRRFFCIRSCPYVVECYRHEDDQYILAVLQGYHHIHSNSKQKQYKAKLLIRAEIWIITGSDQWIRKKKHKTSSISKVKHIE